MKFIKRVVNLGIMLILAIGLFQGSAFGKEVYIDFETLPDGTIPTDDLLLTDQYKISHLTSFSVDPDRDINTDSDRLPTRFEMIGPDADIWSQGFSYDRGNTFDRTYPGFEDRLETYFLKLYGVTEDPTEANLLIEFAESAMAVSGAIWDIDAIGTDRETADTNWERWHVEAYTKTADGYVSVDSTDSPQGIYPFDPNSLDGKPWAWTFTHTQYDIDAVMITFTGTRPNYVGLAFDQLYAKFKDSEPGQIELVKDGTLDMGDDGVANPGDVIMYTFTVTNTGNVTLTNVQVEDPLLSSIECPSGNPIPTLAPGAQETCSGSYAITQVDIDAGQKDNTATATGQDPSGNDVSDDDTHSEPIPWQPGIELLKDGALNLGTNEVAEPGDLITYSFTVTNTGNVTLTQVEVDDPLLSSIECQSGNPIPTLAPGAQETCSGSYAIIQTDIDLGKRDNTAIATGQDPNGNNVSDEDTHNEPIPPQIDASILLEKDGVLIPGDDGVANPGDAITYTFTVTNTGNVTLTNVRVEDPLVPTIECPSGNPIPALASQAKETCSGSYTLTQADIDAGQKDNTAEATGKDSNGNEVSDDDTHSEPIPWQPGIELLKDGALNLGTNEAADPGDLITYSFTVRNTGNVTLTNVLVADPLVPTITCQTSKNPIPSLAPGAQETCTGSYAITQADLDAGKKDNTATATGLDPIGLPISDDDDHSEPLLPQARPAILLEKEGMLDLGDDEVANPGDVITYTLTVTNTGNVTLTDVRVEDPLLSAIECQGGNPIPTLASLAKVTCSGSYEIDQADIDAGQKDNTATATGQDPNGNDVTDNDKAEVIISTITPPPNPPVPPTPVPEPGTMLLFAFGLVGILTLWRRRAK